MVIDASASSQFVSALLLAGARYDDGVTVRHEGPPVPSLPHIDMTVECLREHGVEVESGADLDRGPGPDPRVDVDRRAGPVQRRAVPDAGDDQRRPVRVPGWPRDTTQAGDALRELLSAMGAEVSLDDDGLTVTADAMLGVDADLHDVGELAPAVAALCALASTPSRLRGIAHIRGHETDRLAALAPSCGGLGATSPSTPTACPSSLHRCTAAPSTPTPTTGWRMRPWSSAPRSRASWSRTSRPPRRRSRALPTSGRGLLR